MGTTYSVKIAESLNVNKVEFLKHKIDSILIHVNQLFSTYIPDSEISKFNNSENGMEVSDEFKKLFLLSQEINSNTNGAFDPTVHPLVKLWGFGNKGKIDSLPNDMVINNIKSSIGLENISIEKNQFIKSITQIELDFSAIAKGYGVDAVSQLLFDENFTNFMVEIGGEVYCSGSKFKSNWQIGLQNPFSDSNNDNVLKIANLNNRAMATSGSYRNFFEFNGKKYSHTINPQTGYPVDHNVVSVTIIADNCANADAYATAMMVLGHNDGLQIIENNENLEAVFIVGDVEDYQIIQSSGMAKIMKDL